MRTAAFLFAVIVALPSLGQEPEVKPPPVPEVSAPPPPPAVSAPTLSPAFFERYLQVDYGGQTFVGREKRPLSRLELFNLAGRLDLVKKSEENGSKRLWYAVAAVSVGALTLGGTAALYFSAPELASQACSSNGDVYNQCLADVRTHHALALSTLAVGAVGTVVLATLAAWADPNVLTRDETVELVSKYNAELARSLKQTGLLLTPVVGPGQVGVVVRGAFP